MNKIPNILFICLLPMAAIVSCKKNVTPDLPPASTALNFYIASDLMKTAYDPTRGVTAAYVEGTSDTSKPGSQYYPQFFFGYNANPEFPQVNQNSGINLLSYLRYRAGIRHLQFTDNTNAVVKDTSLSFTPDSWYTLYLADRPAADSSDAAYALLAVQEPRIAQDGKTGVRVINLSPDAGKLEVRLLHTDASPDANVLASPAFGEASTYAFLDQQQAANGLLHLQITGGDGVNFVTGVPAQPGHDYVVVIRGFVNSATRRMNRQMVTVTPALRAEIRTSY